MHRYALIALICVAPALSGCLFGGLAGGAVAGSSATHDKRTIADHATDVYLGTAIDARLAAEQDMPSRWISVEVIEGNVTLTGYLENQEQIDRAVYIVNNLQGVNSVRSELKIGSPAVGDVMSDTMITTEVKRRLFNDPVTSGFSIHVDTVDGKVYLQGIVTSQNERQRAVDIARTVDGVVAVADLLQAQK